MPPRCRGGPGASYQLTGAFDGDRWSVSSSGARVAGFDDIEETLMSEHNADISRREMLGTMGQVAAASVLLPNVLHAAAVLPDEAGDVAIMYPVPEWLAERNRESWKRIVRFYEEWVNEYPFFKLEPVLKLVRGVEQSS